MFGFQLKKKRLSLASPGTFIVYLLFFFLVSLEVPDSRAEPVPVTVGVYINNIYAISLKENRYNIDFYIWFRWKNPEEDENFKPLDSFDVSNGRIESKSGMVTKKLNGGTDYASARIVAVIDHIWNLKRFPLDNHVLILEIEDGALDESALKYVPDSENSIIDPNARVPGWLLSQIEPKITSQSYRTNYGDTSLPTNNQYVGSRFTFSINMMRPGYDYFFKLMTTAFISALVSFLSLFVKPTDLDPRFGLGVGSLFAVVASQIVVASSLPESGTLTLIEYLHNLTLSFIFFSLVVSTLSLRMIETGQGNISRRLDFTCGVSFPILYVAMVISAVFQMKSG